MQKLHDELFPLFVEGKLVSNIHAVFPINEVETAHNVLRNSENIGKVVLTFD
jgi:NADPH:quinone reductase-like Zn-dependent oxidoreductase